MLEFFVLGTQMTVDGYCRKTQHFLDVNYYLDITEFWMLMHLCNNKTLADTLINSSSSSSSSRSTGFLYDGTQVCDVVQKSFCFNARLKKQAESCCHKFTNSAASNQSVKEILFRDYFVQNITLSYNSASRRLLQRRVVKRNVLCYIV